MAVPAAMSVGTASVITPPSPVIRKPRGAPACREANDTAGHREDGRKRLARGSPSVPIASRSASASKLRRRVPLERQAAVVRTHPEPVVGHRDQLASRTPQRDLDAARAGVEAVLDQLLHDRGRALDNLPGGDLVDQEVGQAPDDAGRGRGHGVGSASRRRSSSKRRERLQGRHAVGVERRQRRQHLPHHGREGRLGGSGDSAARSARRRSRTGRARTAPAGQRRHPRERQGPARSARTRVAASRGRDRSPHRAGRPDAATWMPYERSVPPGTTRCRNTMSSFHSRTATWTFSHPGQLRGQSRQLVVVGGEQDLARRPRRVVEVLGHRPGDRQAVERRRAPADLVEQDEAPRVACRRMAAVSVISTRKVLWPRARLSWAPMRVKIAVDHPDPRAAPRARSCPICASSTISAACRMYVDFPAMFGPVITRHSTSPDAEPEVVRDEARAARPAARAPGGGPPSMSMTPPSSTIGPHVAALAGHVGERRQRRRASPTARAVRRRRSDSARHPRAGARRRARTRGGPSGPRRPGPATRAPAAPR